MVTMVEGQSGTCSSVSSRCSGESSVSSQYARRGSPSTCQQPNVGLGCRCYAVPEDFLPPPPQPRFPIIHIWNPFSSAAALRLQKEHDSIHEKFLEERAELERKYEQLYAPLYHRV